MDNLQGYSKCTCNAAQLTKNFKVSHFSINTYSKVIN